MGNERGTVTQYIYILGNYFLPFLNHEFIIYLTLLYIPVYTLVNILLFVKYFTEFIPCSFMISLNSFCPRAERESVGTSYSIF